MRYEFQKQSPDHEVLEQNPSWENSKVNDNLLKFYGNKVWFKQHLRLYQCIPNIAKILWEKMHQHRHHIKLTKDYEETEGSQMLKDPKETSPTLLFFLSVFHNIAANLHSRNTYHSLSLFSREVWGERERERERDCTKHTETDCGVRKSRR